MLLAAVQSVAADAAEHGHPTLNESPQLSLADVLESAVANYPATREMAARRTEALAWRARSRSLIADTPSLSLRYQTDRWQDDQALTEYEAGLQLPLWWPGQRRATRRYATALAAEAEDASHALRWEVSGHVRTSLWQVAAAHDAVVLAGKRVANATQMLAAVERRHELGDVPRSDVMLAQNDQLAAQAAELRARADLRDAEFGYALLTNLQVRPEFAAEALSDRSDIGPHHPALAHALQQVQRAEAQRHAAKKSARGSPTLLLGPRRERPVLGERYEESIGLTLTIPIGGNTHAGTTTAAADRAVAAAVAARDQIHRDLQADLHEAEHELAVIARALSIARQRLELQREQARIGLRAYEAGELDLLALLRHRSAALEAEGSIAALTTENKRLIALYNQAVGDPL